MNPSKRPLVTDKSDALDDLTVKKARISDGVPPGAPTGPSKNRPTVLRGNTFDKDLYGRREFPPTDAESRRRGNVSESEGLQDSSANSPVSNSSSYSPRMATVAMGRDRQPSRVGSPVVHSPLSIAQSTTTGPARITSPTRQPNDTNDARRRPSSAIDNSSTNGSSSSRRPKSTDLDTSNSNTAHSSLFSLLKQYLEQAQATVSSEIAERELEKEVKAREESARMVQKLNKKYGVLFRKEEEKAGDILKRELEQKRDHTRQYGANKGKLERELSQALLELAREKEHDCSNHEEFKLLQKQVDTLNLALTTKLLSRDKKVEELEKRVDEESQISKALKAQLEDSFQDKAQAPNSVSEISQLRQELVDQKKAFESLKEDFSKERETRMKTSVDLYGEKNKWAKQEIRVSDLTQRVEAEQSLRKELIQETTRLKEQTSEIGDRLRNTEAEVSTLDKDQDSLWRCFNRRKTDIAETTEKVGTAVEQIRAATEKASTALQTASTAAENAKASTETAESIRKELVELRTAATEKADTLSNEMTQLRGMVAAPIPNVADITSIVRRELKDLLEIHEDTLRETIDQLKVMVNAKILAINKSTCSILHATLPGNQEDTSTMVELVARVDSLYTMTQKIAPLEHRVEGIEYSIDGPTGDGTHKDCVLNILQRQDTSLSEQDTQIRGLHEMVGALKERVHAIDGLEQDMLRLGFLHKEMADLKKVVVDLNNGMEALQVESRSSAVRGTSDSSAASVPTSNTSKVTDGALEKLRRDLDKIRKSMLAVISEFADIKSQQDVATVERSSLRDRLDSENDSRTNQGDILEERINGLADHFRSFSDEIEQHKAAMLGTIKEFESRTPHIVAPPAQPPLELPETISLMIGLRGRLEKCEMNITKLSNRPQSPAVCELVSIINDIKARLVTLEQNTPITSFDDINSRLAATEQGVRNVVNRLGDENVIEQFKVFRHSIASLEHRYQNLMTNELAQKMVHQLREAQPMFPDPLEIVKAINQLSTHCAGLEQRMRTVETEATKGGQPNGPSSGNAASDEIALATAQASGEKAVKISDWIAALETTIATIQSRGEQVDKVSEKTTALEAAMANLQSSSEEVIKHSGLHNEDLIHLSDRVATLEATVDMILQQLKLSSDKPSHAGPAETLRDELENDLHSLIASLSELRAQHTSLEKRVKEAAKASHLDEVRTTQRKLEERLTAVERDRRGKGVSIKGAAQRIGLREVPDSDEDREEPNGLPGFPQLVEVQSPKEKNRQKRGDALRNSGTSVSSSR